MMFEVILTIPTRSTKERPAEFIHRVIVYHPATSLKEITNELQSKDFIIAEEMYPNQQGVFEGHGPVALNHRYVAKIKEWSPK